MLMLKEPKMNEEYQNPKDTFHILRGLKLKCRSTVSMKLSELALIAPLHIVFMKDGSLSILK